MAGRYILKKSSDSKYMFNLQAGNYEVILTSERYESKKAAENGIESVRVNGVLDERYVRKQSSNGEPYFVLQAANGEVIGHSERYSSVTAMEGGIESVKKNAPTATVVDETA